MTTTELTRRRFSDRNDYRIVVKRLQISSNRGNLDLQTCVLEAEKIAKARNEQFRMSDFICTLLRRGITALVKETPQAATPSMLQIAKEFEPSIKVPEVHEIRPVSDPTIPSIIDYWKKGINGNGTTLRNAYLAGLLSKKDLMDIYCSACAVSGEVLFDPILDRIKDEEMAKRPDLMDLERKKYLGSIESAKRLTRKP